MTLRPAACRGAFCSLFTKNSASPAIFGSHVFSAQSNGSLKIPPSLSFRPSNASGEILRVSAPVTSSFAVFGTNNRSRQDPSTDARDDKDGFFSEILRLASLAQDDKRGCGPLFRRLRRHLPPRGKARSSGTPPLCPHPCATPRGVETNSPSLQ